MNSNRPLLIAVIALFLLSAVVMLPSHATSGQSSTIGHSTTVTTQFSTTSPKSTNGSTFLLEIAVAVIAIIVAIGLIWMGVRRRAT